MAPTWQLHLERDGYSILPAVLRPEEVRELNAQLEHCIERGRAGVRNMLVYPVIMELARDPRLHGLAQQVLGTNAFPFRATFFDKSPQTNWLITWHQDTALPLTQKEDIQGWGPWSIKDGIAYAHAPANALEQVLALRVHLNDSSEENGPLRVLPGTHRQGVLSDEQIENALCNRNPVACVVPEGGVILMRPLTIHASSKSHSTVPRRVLHFEFGTPCTVPAPLRLALA